MGGNLSFVSKPGRGSTFWITLPQAALSEALVSRPQTELAAVAAPVAGGDKTLVYVEDNDASLKLMENLVTGIEGWSLHAVTTAEEGLALVRDLKPDMVLLDINLPGLSGIEAVRALWADSTTAAIPVYAVSAAATEFDIEQGLAAGFEGYITKPIDVNKLVAAITDAPKNNSAELKRVTVWLNN
jgi:protein-histidine pros-kinase